VTPELLNSDVRTQLAELQKREQTARETLADAIRATWEVSQERERLEQAVAFDDAKVEAIENLEAAAAVADDEAKVAKQSAAGLRREADRLTPDPARLAEVNAGLDAAYARVSALGQQLEDGIVAGKPDKALRRISRQQEDAAVKAREFEAERSVLAELTSSADRLRDEAAQQAAAAATARDIAARHRAEADEVPEIARRMAVDAWKESQRIAKLPSERKHEQAPVHALISDGRLLHDVVSGLAYDLDGRPIVAPHVAK
jgi:hypothetical protein